MANENTTGTTAQTTETTIPTPTDKLMESFTNFYKLLFGKIVDNCTAQNGDNYFLSAKQGYILNTAIETINQFLNDEEAGLPGVYAKKADYVSNDVYNDETKSPKHTHQSLCYKENGKPKYKVCISDTGSFRPNDGFRASLGTKQNAWQTLSLNHGIHIYDSGETFASDPPSDDIVMDIGSIYVNKGVVKSNGTTLTSDKNLKTSIKFIPHSIKNFFMNLKPVSYKWKDKDIDNKLHYGFIAQDVKDAYCNEYNNADDIGMIDKIMLDEPDKFGNTEHYALSYTDFIPIITQVLQETVKDVEKLKAEIEELKFENSELKSKLS